MIVLYGANAIKKPFIKREAFSLMEHKQTIWEQNGLIEQPTSSEEYFWSDSHKVLTTCKLLLNNTQKIMNGCSFWVHIKLMQTLENRTRSLWFHLSTSGPLFCYNRKTMLQTRSKWPQLFMDSHILKLLVTINQPCLQDVHKVLVSVWMRLFKTKFCGLEGQSTLL